MEVKEQAESESAASAAFTDFEKLKEFLGQDVVQLWSDASDFFLAANPSKPHVSHERRQRLGRAAVLTAAAAFEAVTNFLSEQILRAGPAGGYTLTEYQIDCLREKRKYLDGGMVKEKNQIYSSKERFLLLFRLVTGLPDRHKTLFQDLDRSFELRDRLVHPKPGPSVGILTDQMWTSAFLGFLTADLVLARMWVVRRKEGSVKHRAFGGN
jgi:hypothetical protein